MKILALDPAISLTGWCSLLDDGSPDGKLHDFGLIRNGEGEGLGKRGSMLYSEALELMTNEKPDLIVVELPAATPRPWGGYRNRGALSAPVYGFAVGCVWGAANLMSLEPIGVPADQWSLGIKKGDEQKTNRVRYATWLYGLPEGKLGPKTTAGNCADAILLARYVLLNRMREGARR